MFAFIFLHNIQVISFPRLIFFYVQPVWLENSFNQLLPLTIKKYFFRGGDTKYKNGKNSTTDFIQVDIFHVIKFNPGGSAGPVLEGQQDQSWRTESFSVGCHGYDVTTSLSCPAPLVLCCVRVLNAKCINEMKWKYFILAVRELRDWKWLNNSTTLIWFGSEFASVLESQEFLVSAGITRIFLPKLKKYVIWKPRSH